MRKALVIAFCFTAVMGSIAYAGSSPVRINVPFAFNAGDAVLPAGEYVLDFAYPTNMKIWNVEGKEGVYVPVLRAPALTSVPEYSISFNRYGDKYFLAGMNNGDFKASVVKSGTEKKLAGKNIRGTVIASLIH